MNAALHRIATLIRKELIAVLKDPRSRLVLFLPIFLQSLLFGYAATFDLNEVPYALLDRDRSQASRDFVARLDGTTVFNRVAILNNARDIDAAIGRKEAILVVQIPDDFERRIQSGQGATVQAITDGRNSNTAGISTAYLSAVVERFNADWSAAHGHAAVPLRVETRAWYNPNLETRWNMIPSLIAALSFLQTLMLTALSVAREREQGTFDQLLVTPLRPREIMIGKAVPPILIGLTQSTIILLVARFWFGIPFQGSLLTLYVGLLLFTTASVGVGLALSAYSATMQQAMLYTFVLLMPMMLLSGLTSAISNMPTAMQYLTLANPLRYAIEMVQRIYLEGAGFEWVYNDMWPLILIAVLTLPTASWLFRHRLV
ncbi:MAG TPA: ABC transporter permease [Povalibacter sp.]|uniref:ABC transporter permease n=1 Tax=Povalibacter sp. TaxID=1962978 RepID=UPI002CDA637F|nr:ABC transporter permease [Povalibacter sp.]HMN46454.1 ABC transporter permease [Povalibacter sp.]